MRHGYDIKFGMLQGCENEISLAQMFSKHYAVAHLRAVLLYLCAEWAKSRLTTLLEGRTEKTLTHANWDVLFYCRTKSVTQYIKGFRGPHSGCLWAS